MLNFHTLLKIWMFYNSTESDTFKDFSDQTESTVKQIKKNFCLRSLESKSSYTIFFFFHEKGMAKIPSMYSKSRVTL